MSPYTPLIWYKKTDKFNKLSEKLTNLLLTMMLQVPAAYVRLCNDLGEPISAAQLGCLLKQNGELMNSDQTCDGTDEDPSGGWIEDEIPCLPGSPPGLCLHSCGVRTRMALLLRRGPTPRTGALRTDSQNDDPLYLLKWISATGPWFGANITPQNYRDISNLLLQQEAGGAGTNDAEEFLYISDRQND